VLRTALSLIEGPERRGAWGPRERRVGGSGGAKPPGLKKKMKKFSYTTMVLLVVTLMAPLFAAGCGKTVGETIDDATITTRVKTSLLNDPDVGGLRIDVDTFKGVVTLSGSVKTKAEEAKAIAIARKIGGVTDVKSTLQVQQ
jgi:hypothetical protein